MHIDLFADQEAEQVWREELAPGVVVLRRFALASESSLLAALRAVLNQAPFRHMTTPGGHRMSVAMSNCGRYGWVSDPRGYRYSSIDPESRQPWPQLPQTFLQLATAAAASAGYPDFQPDACLINRYLPGTRLSLHQDKNECDYSAPIVSVSLGLPAMFQFGGLQRADKTQRIPLEHGDVMVWGGPARLRYHGVLALKEGLHPVLGRRRINLTFRRAR